MIVSYKRVLKLKSPLMYGEDVKEVQKKLNNLGYNCGKVDGYFGKNTDSAVRKYQKANGLVVDGIVGPATWKKLFATSSSGSISTDNTRKNLRYASRNGLFEGLGIEFEAYNKKSKVSIISLRPKVTLQAELSLTSKFIGPMKYEVLNLSLTSDNITASILDKLGSAGISFPYRKNLKMSMDRLVATQNINKAVKYQVINKGSYLEVTFEASLPVDNGTIYQRFIFNIHRSPFDFRNSTVQIPLESKSTYNSLVNFNIWYILSSVGIIVAVASVATGAIGITAGVTCTLAPLFIKFK